MLLEAPVTRTILRLALPNVAVMVVQASIGLIETYFVAKLGLDALAGIALVFPLFMLLQMVSAGAMGGGILSAIARALGAGQRDRANELVWSAVAITIGLGGLTTVAALLLGPKLYALMGGREGSRSPRRSPTLLSCLRARFRFGYSIRLPQSFAGPAICFSPLR
jgi:Na+-driven multidrug efflux pump